MDYLGTVQANITNASTIDNGLKKGIEYRVPSGCIIELDALYAGDNVGGITDLAQGATKQPTEDDCCQACKSAPHPQISPFAQQVELEQVSSRSTGPVFLRACAQSAPFVL